MVVTRAASRLEQQKEEERQAYVISLDGLVCRIDADAVLSPAEASVPSSASGAPPRERSPRGRRFAAGVLCPEAVGSVAPAGSYIRRYLSPAVVAPASSSDEISAEAIERASMLIGGRSLPSRSAGEAAKGSRDQ